MEYHSHILGLVTKYDPGTENGGTFLCHEIILSHMLGKPTERMNFLSDIFYDKMLAAKVEEGLYMRSAVHTKRTVSHDEITSFFVSSFMLGSFHKLEIWDYMVKHFGVYGFNGNRKIPFQPAQYYPWARLAGSKTAFMFLPFYVVSFLISISKDKQQTSSKLLYLDELYAMGLKGNFVDRLLWKFYVKKMKKMYGENFIKEMIDIYFHTEKEDFPLKALSKEL